MTGPAGDQSAGPLPRRRLLLAAGGLAAAGAGFGAGFGSGFGTARAGTGAGPTAVSALAVPTPGEDLMSEHGLLIRILLIYRHLSAGEQVQATDTRDAALIIHDYIEAFHEELEEAYVFPRLVRAGQLQPTVSTLLLQHARGRELTQLILAESGAAAAGSGPLPAAAARRVAGAMTAFVRMYEPHEAREDTVVYPAYRALLSPAEVGDLGEQFAQLQRDQFGPDAFAAMVARVEAIEQALGIYDLAQFTPPNITPPQA
jgi:hemerythrin-like domain-containing protein